MRLYFLKIISLLTITIIIAYSSLWIYCQNKITLYINHNLDDRQIDLPNGYKISYETSSFHNRILSLEAKLSKLQIKSDKMLLEFTNPVKINLNLLTSNFHISEINNFNFLYLSKGKNIIHKYISSPKDNINIGLNINLIQAFKYLILNNDQQKIIDSVETVNALISDLEEVDDLTVKDRFKVNNFNVELTNLTQHENIKYKFNIDLDNSSTFLLLATCNLHKQEVISPWDIKKLKLEGNISPINPSEYLIELNEIKYITPNIELAGNIIQRIINKDTKNIYHTKAKIKRTLGKDFYIGYKQLIEQLVNLEESHALFEPIKKHIDFKVFKNYLDVLHLATNSDNIIKLMENAKLDYLTTENEIDSIIEKDNDTYIIDLKKLYMKNENNELVFNTNGKFKSGNEWNFKGSIGVMNLEEGLNKNWSNIISSFENIDNKHGMVKPVLDFLKSPNSKKVTKHFLQNLSTSPGSESKDVFINYEISDSLKNSKIGKYNLFELESVFTKSLIEANTQKFLKHLK